MGSNEIDDKELFVKVQWEEEGYVNVVPVKLNHRGEISKYSYKDLHRVIRSECSLDGKRLVYIDDEGDEVSECENCDGKGISSPPIRPRGEYVIIVISWWHCFDFAVALFRGPEKHLEIDCPAYGQYHSCCVFTE